MHGARSHARGNAKGWIAALALLVAGTCGAAAGDGAAAIAPDLAIEQAAALPALTDLRMSPDGTQLMVLRPLGGATGVSVIDLATRKERVVLAANASQQQLSTCDWASSTHLVCQLLVASQYPRAGAQPLTTLSSRALAVDVRTAKSLLLDAGTRAFAMERFVRGALLSTLPADPGHVLLLAMRSSSLVGVNQHITPHVERVSLEDGSRTTVQGELDGVTGWLADPGGTVRAGIVDGRTGARLRVWRGERWVQTQLGEFALEHDFQPLFIDARGEQLIVAAHMGSATRGVHVLDTATGRIARTLHADPRRDFVGRLFVVKGEPQALLAEGEQLQFVPLTDDWRALGAELARALPEQQLVPWSSDDAARRFTVRSSTPHVPTTWYLYDRDTRNLARIGAEHQQPAGASMVSRWVSYAARDGLQIPALLSLPAAGARGLPTVVVAHDGPLAATRSGHDGLVALLVQRGFAVLQPQYRGSYGFGSALTLAGRNPWTDGAANDLEDGLRWLRASGVADATRACVIGRGYGGYVALQFAYRAGDGVRCVGARTPLADIDVNTRFGHLSTMLVDARPPTPGGSFGTDDLVSPARHAGAFVVPLLLSRSDTDDFQEMHATRLLDALAPAGKAPLVVIEAGVDLHDGVLDNRRRWFTALDAFLRQHLQTPVQIGAAAAAGALAEH